MIGDRYSWVYVYGFVSFADLCDILFALHIICIAYHLQCKHNASAMQVQYHVGSFLQAIIVPYRLFSRFFLSGMILALKSFSLYRDFLLDRSGIEYVTIPVWLMLKTSDGKGKAPKMGLCRVNVCAHVQNFTFSQKETKTS